MAEKWNQGCALWFWRYFVMEFETFDYEIDAARYAASMAENEDGTPVGLQYSDGRKVKVEDWQAFKDAEKVFKEVASVRAAQPPRPTRLILNPFDLAPVRVDAGEPQWLGIRPETLINPNKG